MGNLFNTAVVAALGQLPSSEVVTSFNRAPYLEQALAGASERAAYLVDLAKVAALQLMDEDNVAADLMARYIK